ncbi:Bro-N domain-containing protein [Kitasatospora sp. MBT66]|uniref:BRO-N domain-containing protein n=1 Tax=Kitasatospora sp. MBT66 TaxID=1444769 RepID=UPI00068AF060|nr:Bro-N domain-containing protein [Kitasatospora sp. MBT66]
MDDEQTMQGRMELVRSSFPVTGQPIRVVMIDGEPWFVTADVCRILGRGNPTDAVKVLERHQHRTVDLRAVTLVPTEGRSVSADQKAYRRGNPILGVVSEAGLYGLLMRSDKESARPFRDWITDELLPSVRRGDTDIPTQHQRMAKTLSEAIGQQVYVVARIEHEDWPGLTVHSDGTVHCRHGEMRLRLPGQDDSGPPFGPYFECPGGEHVGIRGSRPVPGCPKLRIVDLVRMRDEARAGDGTGAVPEHALMYAVVDRGRIDRLHGTPRQFAAFMREYRG